MPWQLPLARPNSSPIMRPTVGALGQRVAVAAMGRVMSPRGARLAQTPAATASWPIERWIAPVDEPLPHAARRRLLEGADARHRAVVAEHAAAIEIRLSGHRPEFSPVAPAPRAGFLCYRRHATVGQPAEGRIAMTRTEANQPAGRMTGGRALAEMLRLHGVGPMFGMGGFQLLPFYDALGAARPPATTSSTTSAAAPSLPTPTRGSPTAPASATPRSAPAPPTSSRPGRVVQCRHPDGRDRRRHQPRPRLEEHDAGGRQVEILRPAVKELIRVEVTERIPELVRRAFAVATSGRPGPVVLDVPEDVCHGEHDFDAEDFGIDPRPWRRRRAAAGPPAPTSSAPPS